MRRSLRHSDRYISHDSIKTSALDIIRPVDLYDKHNINFSHAASLHAAGVLRVDHEGSRAPFRLSLDVNPVFARIFPLDKRDAPEKSFIPPGMFIEFRPSLLHVRWKRSFGSLVKSTAFR